MTSPTNELKLIEAVKALGLNIAQMKVNLETANETLRRIADALERAHPPRK